MLTGFPAFGGHSDAETLAKVRLGVYSTETLEISDVSPECQSFISKLLCMDPEQRLSAAQALEDEWIMMNREEMISAPCANAALEHVRDFTITTGKRIQ